MEHEFAMSDDGAVLQISNRTHGRLEMIVEQSIDDLFEAVHSRAAGSIQAFFGDDVVFNSPSGVDFVGPQAARGWQGFFGCSMIRTSGAFVTPAGTYKVNFEFTAPGATRATANEFEVELEGGRIVYMNERCQRD